MIVWSEKLQHTTAKKPKLKIDLMMLSSMFWTIHKKHRRTKNNTWCGKNSEKLSFCYQDHNYGAALKDTITRWLKNLLCEAGLFKFCSPQFSQKRSLVSNFKSGCSLDDISAVAIWVNKATFQKFYNKSVERKTNEYTNNNKLFCFIEEHKKWMKCVLLKWLHSKWLE